MQIQKKSYDLGDERRRAEAELHEVPGFEGYYCATEDGRVWSCGRWIEHKSGERYKWGAWLEPKKTNNAGYLNMALCVDGDRYDTTVAEVISLTFYGEHPEDLTIHHVDGNLVNTHIDNLTWGPCGSSWGHSTPLRRRAA